MTLEDQTPTDATDDPSGAAGKLSRRPRRLRHSAALRRMLQQFQIRTDDLIFPLFVTHGNDVKRPIESMPGQFQFSVDRVVQEAQEAFELGIPAVILFGIPATKDDMGSDAYADQGIVQQAIKAIKKQLPQLLVIADTCLCEYTNHGHCGVVDVDSGYLLNDPTLQLLQRIAVSQAKAGADIIAPSGMIDGMVQAIRESLDQHGLDNTPIMSYSVKYASSYYGPFRDAADGAPQFGDRRTHQMDPAEKRQAIQEAQLDVQQGADFLMVKPALAYLDVISELRQRFPEMPIVAYNVSGEYSMVKAAAANGWLDERAVVMETLIGMKRAGADLIITYHAKDICQWLSQ